MGATVTNQDLGVTTKTSDHTAITQGTTDICYDPPKAKKTPHVNHVKTERAVEHTTGKTLFQGGNVVRIGEAITPSEPAHGDSGGGVVSGTYRAEARATRGSPNVRAEGKPPARTNDPTTQNHGNTTGKIMQNVPPSMLSDDPTEYLKRCSHEESKIKCGHEGFVQKKQIEIWRNDTITVQSKRKNAKEPNAPPDCLNPPHMKWEVKRTGGLDATGAPIPEKYEEFTGDTLNLPDAWFWPLGGDDWTAPQGTLEYGGEQERIRNPQAQRQQIALKNQYAQQNAAARGSDRVENQDGQRAYQQSRDHINNIATNADRARTVGKLALSAAQFYVAWRADQNPPKITIKGNACSGGCNFDVLAYPNSKYTFEFPLDGLIAAGRWISRSMSVVRSFGQLANVQVENSIQCPGEGTTVSVEFQWKEDAPEPGADPSYEIQREAEFQVAGILLAWKFEVSCPLTNVLNVLPFGGPVAARAIGWISQRLGVEASVGLGAEVTIKAAVSVTCKYSKEEGLKFDNAAIKIPIDLKLYLFIRVRLRDWLHIEGQLLVAADPALALEGKPDGLKLKSADFMIRAGFAGVIHIDTWFYSFHESATWYPEDWTCRVHHVDLWTIVGK